MTNGYIKVVGASFMQTKVVDLPEPDEDGDKEKSVVAKGFIKYQDFFFFDSRNPGSVKQALKDAQDYIARSQTKKHPARISIYNPPTLFEGPWTGLPFVGQGLGATSS